jgi:hypothetical protein
MRSGRCPLGWGPTVEQLGNARFPEALTRTPCQILAAEQGELDAPKLLVPCGADVLPTPIVKAPSNGVQLNAAIVEVAVKPRRPGVNVGLMKLPVLALCRNDQRIDERERCAPLFAQARPQRKRDAPGRRALGS